jgi:hypothetical protein
MAICTRSSRRLERPKLYPRGRPGTGIRAIRHEFWLGIAAGMSTADAATAAGVSSAAGKNWFREFGGMSPSHLRPSAPPLSGRYLSFAEREQIALLNAKDRGGSRDRAGAGPGCIDDLARAAPQTSQWRPRVPGNHGAMARGPRGPATKTCQARDQSGITQVCAGSASWCGPESQGRQRRRTCGTVEAPSARSSTTPSMGSSVEPGADRSPALARFPQR